MQNYTFSLDMIPGGIPPVLNVSQGDIGRTYTAKLYWNNQPWTPGDITATLRGKKPDKTVFEYNATISNSNCSFSTTEQMTIIPGPVEIELVFTSGGNVVASANFIMLVEASPWNPDALSESDVNTLAELVSDQIPPAVGDWLAENVDNAPTSTVIADAVGDYIDTNGLALTLDSNGIVRLT